MAKADSDPISDDEWFLRRIHVDRFRNQDGVLEVTANAFEPRFKGRDPDTDGISLYRAACLDNPEEILKFVPEEKWPNNGIVRISKGHLIKLGLSIFPCPDPKAPIPGHVVIPELNALDYKSDASKFTYHKEGLAKAASEKGNIVRIPPALTST